MQIDLKVRHQRILGVQQVPRLVIEKTRLFVYLNLDFDEEWNDCEIVVVLTNDYNAGHPVEMLWTGEPLEVPDELLVTGRLRVSCVGTRYDGMKIDTKFMQDGIQVHRAGDQAGFNPTDSVPELWEQVLAAVSGIDAKSIQSIEQTMTSTADDGLNEVTFFMTNGKEHKFQWKNGSKGHTGDRGRQGVRGERGEPGVGIQSIQLTEVGAAGNEYTVTLTDGRTATIIAPVGSAGQVGTPGEAVTITSIVESGVSGGTSVITFSDGSTLNVKNGKDGAGGDSGDGADGVGIQDIQLKQEAETGNTYTITLTDGNTYDFVAPAGPAGANGVTPHIGSNGNWWIGETDTGVISHGFSGSYNDLTNKPTIPSAYTHPESHPASMITGLATVATSGSYNDLTNKPTIPSAYTHPESHPASMITGLAAVATSGSYNDLTNKPTIPSAYTHPESHPASMITGLAAVATSGSYNDLSDVPTNFTPATHSQPASTITAGTLAGQVVANASGQATGTSLVRNTKLVAAEETPTVNGEIFWVYG